MLVSTRANTNNQLLASASKGSKWLGIGEWRESSPRGVKMSVRDGVHCNMIYSTAGHKFKYDSLD